MVEVLMLALGLVMGSALGYWSVLLRVWRLEKELEMALLRVLEMEKVKKKQSELEMALDLAHSKAMGRD
jgi:hypothetical protein